MYSMVTVEQTQESIRSKLCKVESSQNSLHGCMSPQLEMALDWNRVKLLEALLDLQLKEFNKD